MTPQNWNAENYQAKASFVPQLGSSVLQLLAPQPGENILDLGCGDGDLTLQIQNYRCHILGIDPSPEMIAMARERGLNAHVLAAENLSYKQQFDAVFTNAALHWVSDINLVVNNVYNSLKYGGRFIGEFGGEGNIKTIVDAISKTFQENKCFGTFNNPWYFPSPDEYKLVLKQAGFEIISIELISRPTHLKHGIDSWLKVFANGIINDLNEVEKSIFIKSVKQQLKPLIFSQANGWVADYVRLRFKAIKNRP